MNAKVLEYEDRPHGGEWGYCRFPPIGVDGCQLGRLHRHGCDLDPAEKTPGGD